MNITHKQAWAHHRARSTRVSARLHATAVDGCNQVVIAERMISLEGEVGPVACNLSSGVRVDATAAKIGGRVSPEVVQAQPLDPHDRAGSSKASSRFIWHKGKDLASAGLPSP